MEPQHVVPGPIIEPVFGPRGHRGSGPLHEPACALSPNQSSSDSIRSARSDHSIDRQALDGLMSKGVRNGFEEARRNWDFRKTIERSAVPRSPPGSRTRSRRSGARARFSMHLSRDSRDGRARFRALLSGGPCIALLTRLRSRRRTVTLRSSRTSCRTSVRSASTRSRSPDIVCYLNLRRMQMTGNPGHKKRRLVSESTVRRERGLLQSIFERAIDEGPRTLKTRSAASSAGRTRHGLGC